MDWDILIEYLFHNSFSKMALFCVKTQKRQDEHLGFVSVRVIVVSIRTNFLYKKQAYFSLKLRHILFGDYYRARTVTHIIDCQIID